MVMIETDKGECLVRGDRVDLIEIKQDGEDWNVWVLVFGDRKMRLFGQHPTEAKAKVDRGLLLARLGVTDVMVSNEKEVSDA